MKRLVFLLISLLGILYLATGGNLNTLFQRAPIQSRVPSSRFQILSEESARVSAIEKTLPSVVTVSLSKTAQTGNRIELNPFDPFGSFRTVPGENRQIEQNIGSGFVVDKEGLIVTNKHVVADSSATYKIITSDGKEYAAQTISRDPLNDLAIVKIDAKDLTPLELGDSESVKLGQDVIAIGTPLGQFTNTVTAGIVSGLARGITAGSPFEGLVERLDNVIQTDAAINPGNSGGPLINLAGQAIGVNTAVSGEGQNIGFAIPINVVTDLLKNFDRASNRIQRPLLGIRYQLVTPQNAALKDIPQGALVIEVVEGSPAQKAKILPDDIITHIDGKEIKGEDSTVLSQTIAKRTIGETVSVRLWREGKVLEKSARLEVFDSE